MKPMTSIACLVLGASLLSAPGQAGAVSVSRSFVQNATGSCQSALPVFEGQIRKRPLALQNEGFTPAFVTCSFMNTDRSVDGMKAVYLYADNDRGVDRLMTCTLVTGIPGSMAPEFIVKSILLPANSRLNEFLWTPADHGGQNFNNYTTNVSCNLAVGTGLTASFVYYDEDIGS